MRVPAIRRDSRYSLSCAVPEGYLAPPGMGVHFNYPDRTVAARAATRAVMGRRFGLVTSCQCLPSETTLPSLLVYVARGSPRVAWRSFGKFAERPLGTGVSTEHQPARSAAIAEVVERYTSFVSGVCDDRRIRAPYTDVAEHAVAPSDFALLSRRQYRSFPALEPLTDGRTVDWCWAFSLTRSCPALMPEALTYPSRSNQPPNNFIPESNSTGVACDVAVPHAILTALCEVLERDALAVAWHGRMPWVALEPDGSAAADLISGPLAACDHEFSLFQVPSDYPFPVVLALAWNKDHAPYAVTGAACRPDPVDAARKALFEASQMLWRLRGRDLTPPQQISRFDDHALFFATADGASALRRRLGEVVDRRPLREEVAAGSTADELHRAVSELAELDLEVLTIELTTLDVATAGFRVFRVVVPGTIDVAADARYIRRGGQRLYELPVRLGLSDRVLGEEELNLLPVPLA